MPAASRGTIVVVEQSAAAQELMEHVLREAGHRVLVTRNPQEALELGRRVRIDVLVADVAKLGEGGTGLVEQLRTSSRRCPSSTWQTAAGSTGPIGTMPRPCRRRSRSTSF